MVGGMPSANTALIQVPEKHVEIKGYIWWIVRVMRVSAPLDKTSKPVRNSQLALLKTPAADLLFPAWWRRSSMENDYKAKRH